MFCHIFRDLFHLTLHKVNIKYQITQVQGMKQGMLEVLGMHVRVWMYCCNENNEYETKAYNGDFHILNYFEEKHSGDSRRTMNITNFNYILS